MSTWCPLAPSVWLGHGPVRNGNGEATRKHYSTHKTTVIMGKVDLAFLLALPQGLLWLWVLVSHCSRVNINNFLRKLWSGPNDRGYM